MLNLVVKIVPPRGMYYYCYYLGGGPFLWGGGLGLPCSLCFLCSPLAMHPPPWDMQRGILSAKERPNVGCDLDEPIGFPTGLTLFSRQSPLNKCSPSAGWMRASSLIFFHLLTPVESEQRTYFGVSVGKQGGGFPVYSARSFCCQGRHPTNRGSVARPCLPPGP